MDRDEPENMGEGGYCICLECDTRVPHRNWITCLEMNCPVCGAIMVREGSPYHLYALRHGLTPDGGSDRSSGSLGRGDRFGRLPSAVSQGI